MINSTLLVCGMVGAVVYCSSIVPLVTVWAAISRRPSIQSLAYVGWSLAFAIGTCFSAYMYLHNTNDTIWPRIWFVWMSVFQFLFSMTFLWRASKIWRANK